MAVETQKAVKLIVSIVGEHPKIAGPFLSGSKMSLHPGQNGYLAINTISDNGVEVTLCKKNHPDMKVMLDDKSSLDLYDHAHRKVASIWLHEIGTVTPVDVGQN